MDASKRFIRFFNELTIDDIPLVGGKNASLAEMYRELMFAKKVRSVTTG